MKIFFIVFFSLIFLFGVTACSNYKSQAKGIVDHHLAPCSWTPNCVSSSSEGSQYIKPLPYIGDQSFNEIEDFLSKNYDSKIVNKTPEYLHIVVTTRYLKFKDDLEFLIDEKDKMILVRSASRVGYSDLGVNRERIEALREYLNTLDN